MHQNTFVKQEPPKCVEMESTISATAKLSGIQANEDVNNDTYGCITRVGGILLGHYNHPLRPTGCSVVIAPAGATAAVDVRGAAPGTRETDLLACGNLVEKVHAILLAGGSAWGLAAATGAVQWLEEQGIGLDTGYGKLPLVPAAVLFDLPLGDARIRPDAESGYRACQHASAKPGAAGNIGAGAGASVGKLYGSNCAMKGGAASASITVRGVTVGALVACNAVGDIIDPATATLLAGSRTAPDQLLLRHSTQALLQGQSPGFALPGVNTTIGIIATDAALTRPQTQHLAVAAHTGLARCISPVHTQLDGDTLFALSTGTTQQDSTAIDMVTLAAMAAHATSMAVLRAIRAAQGIRLDTLWLPAWQDLPPST